MEGCVWFLSFLSLIYYSDKKRKEEILNKEERVEATNGIPCQEGEQKALSSEKTKDKHPLLRMIWPALSLLNSNPESAKGAQMYSVSQLQ